MLILTRRVGETLMIGDSVSVTVLGVKGNQVRIGITAPKDVAVHREEIYQLIQRGDEPGGAGSENSAEYRFTFALASRYHSRPAEVQRTRRGEYPGVMPEWPKGLTC
ncbi:hypothetical protein G6F46_014679 [Rhizopus delemar]|nr:hypothetical protein G6F46_014679 [Rhizopus delemar]